MGSLVTSVITVRNEVAKVMFLQVSVCPQGGGGILACLAGGIPACLAARGVLSQHALQVVSQHALQQVSRGVPGLGGAWSWGGLLWGACSRGMPTPEGCLLLGGVDETPPKQTATVVDGMHPTGMHSCWWMAFI